MRTQFAGGLMGAVLVMILISLALVVSVRKALSYVYYEDHSLRGMHRTEDLDSNVVARSLDL